MDYTMDDSPSSSHDSEPAVPMETDRSPDSNFVNRNFTEADYCGTDSPSDDRDGDLINKKLNGFQKFNPTDQGMEEKEDQGSQISRDLSPLVQRFSDQESEEEVEKVEQIEEVKPKEEPYEFVPPSQRDDAPLAGIIYPELEDIDPRFGFLLKVQYNSNSYMRSSFKLIY